MTAVALAGCIEPTNPCDPDADPDVQASGTRIGGVVVDQSGSPLAGVAVGVVGRAEAAVTSSDGTFEIVELPPNLDGWELIASPSAPLVGGRVKSAPLACNADVADVELVVVVPPASPEVELVRASSDRRMFAAFGATAAGVGGVPEPVNEDETATLFEGAEEGTHRGGFDVVADCAVRTDSAAIAYRAQIRAPFEEWKDAVLAPFLWSEGIESERADELYVDRVEDVCAAAACAQLAYLESSLANPNARCVEIVGYRDGADGSQVLPLLPYGSYQVRVRAELRVDDAIRASFALPERVLADAPSSTGQMSLVPGALLPVAGADGLARQVGEVLAIVTTAGGRFAVVEDDALSVLGDGKDTLSEEAQDAAGGIGVDAPPPGSDDAVVPQNAVGEDGDATAAVAGDFTEGAGAGAESARPVALLPAGDWVRVIRRLEDGSASVEKVYVGASADEARAGADFAEEALMAEQPALQIDPITEGAGTELRSFAYLLPENDVLGVDVNPRDAYVLLYGTSFVLSEQAPLDQLATSYFAQDASADVDGTIVSSDFFTSDDGAADVGLGGACAQMSADGTSTPNRVNSSVPGGRVNVSVCYDVGAGLEEDVDLRDIEAVGTGHVVSDAANDRVLVAARDDLVCEGCNATEARPLALQLREVRVGREPLGMVRARVLEGCGVGGGEPASSSEVVLVANHGSGDLSVLADELGELREVAVVPLAALPTGFLDDPVGPTCADPFVWVLADDGRTIPVDMREEPSVPLCNGAPCEVGTRGRGFVGAVARAPGALGPSRALVGGNGLLGELGFFRPRALRGAAFADPGDVAEPSPPPEPPSKGGDGGGGETP